MSEPKYKENMVEIDGITYSAFQTNFGKEWCVVQGITAKSRKVAEHFEGRSARAVLRQWAQLKDMPEICASCKKEFPVEDMVMAGNLLFCPKCAEKEGKA